MATVAISGHMVIFITLPTQKKIFFKSVARQKKKSNKCPTEYGQWLFLFFLTFIYTGKIDYMGPHSDADN